MKDFISINDYSPADLTAILDSADQLKKELKEGKINYYLKDKSLAMIFSKSSTRTRVSFEIGMRQLGGNPLFLSSSDIQLGRGESIADTARVLSRYADGIMIRTSSHQDVLDLAKYSSIPIINGLTDLLHPCQVMADLQTIREHKGTLAGLKLAYVGDGNNMVNSLMHAASKLGIHMSIATPKGYEADQQCIDNALKAAELSSAKFLFTNEPKEAVENADIVYTDTWVSMGQEEEKKLRIKNFAGYTVDSKLMSYADKSAIFLHCLPAYRGFEVTNSVIEGPQSVIFDQAENRLHAQKAIMLRLLSA